jgi:L-aminopeptidase/D-esterase-like protein
MHVKPVHVAQALAHAQSGPVAEGCVGGDTGMICHGFKGGIGTSSRVAGDGWTIGALVQANSGDLFLAFSTANGGLHETGELSTPMRRAVTRPQPEWPYSHKAAIPAMCG